MIVDGVYVQRDTFENQCAEKGITNPEWVDWIIRCFDALQYSFVEQAIKAGVEEMNEANRQTRNSNETDKNGTKSPM